MNPQPFTISRLPKGYALTIGDTTTEHRFRRQALSHGLHATRKPTTPTTRS